MHQSTNPRFGVDERTPYGLLRLGTSIEKPLNEAEDTTVPNRLSHQVQQVQLANVGGESRYAMNEGAFRAVLVKVLGTFSKYEYIQSFISSTDSRTKSVKAALEKS